MATIVSSSNLGLLTFPQKVFVLYGGPILFGLGSANIVIKSLGTSVYVPYNGFDPEYCNTCENREAYFQPRPVPSHLLIFV